MNYSLSDKNIQKAVENAAEFLESNSVSRKEVRQWTLLMEQLLLLYRENDGGSAFSMTCTRRKHRVRILLRVQAKQHDYLSSGEDLLIENILANAAALPKWSREKNENVICYETELQTPGIWNLRFLLPYLKKERKNCILAVFFQLCMIGTNIVIPVLTAKLITAYGGSELTHVLMVIGVLFVCSVCCYFFDFCTSHFFVSVYNNLLNELETDLSRKVFRLEDACINKYGTGMFVQRMVSDTESVAAGFSNVTAAFSVLFQAFGIIIAVGFISLPLCLVFAATTALTFVLEVRRIKIRAQNDRKFRHKRDRYTGVISEMIHGAKDVKLQNGTEPFIKKMSQTIREANRANYKLEMTAARGLFFRKGAKEICDLVLYAAMAFLVLSQKLLPSEAVIVLNYNLTIATTGTFIGAFLIYVHTITVSSERIFQILFDPDFKEERFGTLCPAGFFGDVAFQDVTFRYPQEDQTAQARPVLHKIGFCVRAGEKIAIVGKSGSGKTTIFNLLMGLYRPDGGKILIDGQDIEKLSAGFLRGNISAVSQNPYIFNMSVRENLNIAKEHVTDEEIERACKAACIYDEIMAMPKQFDSVLGEGGVYLSGGQRQRLAIARCLLRKTKMILLDEATSALDNETQENVIGQIGKLFSDCTVITAAHRLSTIISSDRILFLSEGRVLAEGTHEELLKSCEEYRTLYQTEWAAKKAE